VSDRSAQIKLATAAYHAGYLDDWPGAARCVEELAKTYGTAGVTTAMLAWIDTAIAASGLDGGGPVRIAWNAVETGAIQTDADAVSVEVRWAGRLLAARLADDERGFHALLSVLPTLTPSQTGDHILGLLRSCVLTIKQGKQSGKLPGGSDA
jgi:hypothetical protein